MKVDINGGTQITAARPSDGMATYLNIRGLVGGYGICAWTMAGGGQVVGLERIDSEVSLLVFPSYEWAADYVCGRLECGVGGHVEWFSGGTEVEAEVARRLATADPGGRGVEGPTP
jgi:hypothetical protein